MLRRQLLATMTITALALPGVALAQAYPDRPIKVMQGFAPGGNADNIARTVGLEMSKGLGQSIVVEAQAGAGGTIAATTVAKAKPDGYTLLLTSTALAANHILFKKIPYDPVKDLMPVSFVSTVPTVLVVHNNVPAQNLKELVQLARSKPETMNYGSAGNGSGNHLTTEVFLNTTGLKVQHIPYKGGGAVMADLVAGQVTFVFAVLPTALPFITSGKLRALGVSSAQRNPALPDVPTVAESGYPNFNVAEWVGVFAPAGTPAAIIDKLNSAINQTLKHPDVVARFKSLGADIVGGPPSVLDTYFRSEVNKWTRLAEQVKFEAAD